MNNRLQLRTEACCRWCWINVSWFNTDARRSESFLLKCMHQKYLTSFSSMYWVNLKMLFKSSSVSISSAVQCWCMSSSIHQSLSWQHGVFWCVVGHYRALSWLTSHSRQHYFFLFVWHIQVNVLCVCLCTCVCVAVPDLSAQLDIYNNRNCWVSVGDSSLEALFCARSQHLNLFTWNNYWKTGSFLKCQSWTFTQTCTWHPCICDS